MTKAAITPLIMHVVTPVTGLAPPDGAAVAAALARGGLSHSRRTYPDPPARDWPAKDGPGAPALARAGRNGLPGRG
jgi:hypothetical protein